MSNIAFKDVTGFNLKWPSTHNNRPALSSKGEWIELRKEKNKLPTATLRTWVLYYRNNGDASDNVIDLLEPSHTDLNSWGDGKPNFRFYNNYNNSGAEIAGGQLGSIWGFPLFDVSGGAGNWPFFKSCLTNGTADICGNETMLVKLNNRNIIVLDFSGYDEDNTKGAYNDISNNLNPYVTDGFYMTLRIKSSSERLVPDSTPSTTANGKHFHGYRNIASQKKFFCSLVEYTFECDIIGPKPLLDLTLDYFSWNDGGRGKLFGTTSGQTLAIPRVPGNTVTTDNTINANSYTTDISINIITGSGYGSQEYSRIDTEYIYDKLTFDPPPLGSSRTWKNVLALKIYYFHPKWWLHGYSLTKLIGGKSLEMERDDFNHATKGKGYYGSNYGTNWNQTDRETTLGWQWNIDLSANSNLNKWPVVLDTDAKNYDLNNILWCSLRSPKKTRVQKISTTGTAQYRFITNYIDVSGVYAVGGGYGKYPNTIDLPRSSWLPYYSSSGTVNTCVSILDFDGDTSNAQYLDSDGSKLPNTGDPEFGDVRTIDEVGHYIIYYKLLIPAIGTDCTITYSFGKNNDGKVTFFRQEDMSGTAIPPYDNTYGAHESSVWGNRNQESITLKWSAGETDLKTIILTDVASGLSKHDATILYNDPSLNKTRNSTTEDYDISCNIFQPLFTAVDENGEFTSRDENPYSVKIFDSNSTHLQYYDISYTPFNYKPYRYINISTLFNGTSLSCENDFYWDAEYEQPIIQLDEKLKYNVDKIYARAGGTYDLNATPPFFLSVPCDGTNINLPIAIVLDPSNSKIVDEIIIDVSNEIIDASYSVLPSVLSDDVKSLISQEEIAIFTKQATTDILTFEDLDGGGVKKMQVGGGGFLYFYGPHILSEKNRFIPDYWRLQEKINKLRQNSQMGNNIEYITNYGYFAKWENQITTTAVFDILNIILKGVKADENTGELGGLLINSNKDSVEWSAVDANGPLITGNILFEVQGATGLSLTERPIVVQMTSISTGPFGSSGINYIGDTAGGTGSGINNANYICNIVLPSKLRQGNNNGTNFPNTNNKSYNGLFNISLRGWKEYPVLTPPRQNIFFNDINIAPSPLPVLLVDISAVVQTNGSDYRDMLSDDNTTATLKWTGFYFSSDVSWNTYPLGQDGNIEWTISRYNLATGVTKTRYIGILDFNSSTGEYTWKDSDINVYDKFRWTVKGVYKWLGITKLISGASIPEINVPGFTTPDCFICKHNRFEYGRFNTTSTNLKLYRPLLINTPAGQVNKFNNKVCGGGCVDPKNPSLNLFSGGSRISSSNNIYANTTNQLSKKQTYVLLAKSRFRSFR